VTNLGWILMDAGHPGDAEPLLREALARKRNPTWQPTSRRRRCDDYLTSTLTQLGRYGEGERLMRDALDIDAGAYARPNAHVAWHLNDLAIVLALEGKFERSQRVLREGDC
jgi:hypothetical protein